MCWKASRARSTPSSSAATAMAGASTACRGNKTDPDPPHPALKEDAMSALPQPLHAPVPDDDFQLDQVVAGLRRARVDWRERHRLQEPRGRELPSAELLGDIIKGLRGALFPLRLGPPAHVLCVDT
eukprot:Opistho-2@33227